MLFSTKALCPASAIYQSFPVLHRQRRHLPALGTGLLAPNSVTSIWLTPQNEAKKIFVYMAWATTLKEAENHKHVYLQLTAIWRTREELVPILPNCAAWFNAHFYSRELNETLAFTHSRSTFIHSAEVKPIFAKSLPPNQALHQLLMHAYAQIFTVGNSSVNFMFWFTTVGC